MFGYSSLEEVASLKHLVSVWTADRLAQLEENRTTVREVVGSNPGRTTTQGL